MPLPGWTVHGKGSSMSDVIYKGYTVKLRSRPLPSGMWEPRAIVWWEEDNMSNYEPISTGESQDTEALADALVLARAKAWVDAKEQ
jgi:hypothetical protein